MRVWPVGWPVASTSCHTQPPLISRFWGVAASGTERLSLISQPLVPGGHPPGPLVSRCGLQEKPQTRKEVRNG
jgi:hypothetical protein